jgi:predicted secreted protein
MFENNLLNKLSDAIPADMKDKVLETVKEKLGGNAADLKSSAMERLGFTKPVAAESSPVASPQAAEDSAAPGEETSDLAVDEPETEEAEDEANA